MTAMRMLACFIGFAAAQTAFAGGSPPPPNDPAIAAWVPVGVQSSTVPIAATIVATGVVASSAQQGLAGVSDWGNTDIWPVEMGTGQNPGRYIEVTLDPADDRVVRVTRVRYASRSYGASNGMLALATDADAFGTPLGAATSSGSGVRDVPLAIYPSTNVEFGPGPRTFRLYPYQTTAILDWLDLVGPTGGLAIDGRIALVRAVPGGQDRYSFTTDTLGGSALPAAITHVQFALAPPVVVLVPFAATAPRTACLAGTALLDIEGPVSPAGITGLGAPCGTIDPSTTTATTLWRLANDEVYGLQVMQTSPTLVFRVRRFGDTLFANGFE